MFASIGFRSSQLSPSFRARLATAATAAAGAAGGSWMSLPASPALPICGTYELVSFTPNGGKSISGQICYKENGTVTTHFVVRAEQRTMVSVFACSRADALPCSR